MPFDEASKKTNKKSANKKFPHSGHRQRVITKYMEHGLASFAEHEVLELLLFFSIPRMDTNLLAHEIIDEFGSLKNVLEASPEDLKMINGVGDNTAALLSLFRAVQEYKNTNISCKRKSFRNSYEIGEFCKQYFSEHVEESAIMLAMDSSFNLKKVTVISTGTVNETAFYASKIMKTALTLKASTVVIAHNHPGGDVQPSVADIQLTIQLKKLMESVHIDLMDHYICNEYYFTSLRERGFFDGATL